MRARALLAAGPYQVASADFDGTNDYMTRGAGLSSAADSKLGTFSAWLRLDGLSAVANGNILCATSALGGSSALFSVALLPSAGTIRFTAFNATPTTILNLDSASLSPGASWHHIIASWDMADVAKRHIYVDDSSAISVNTYTNDVIDYTQGDWAVGALANGTQLLSGCLADLWFAPGQYIDLSVTANRRLFRSALGKPVFLGLDGSAPTGVSPLVYHKLYRSDAVASFATNRGSGGNFTITGTLDPATTNPSD